MSSDTKNNLTKSDRFQKSTSKLGVPLPLVLIVPFVIQIFAAVCITGDLSLFGMDKKRFAIWQQIYSQKQAVGFHYICSSTRHPST